MLSLYITALAMGFFGSLHCVGMCGGITIAFSQASSSEKRLQLTFIYQTFRIVSYAILGAISAALGHLLTDVKIPILTLLSGIFMLLMGLYLLNFAAPLLSLEKIGHKVWRKIQPFQKSFLPMQSSIQAMVIGLLWGFLPCGLVYSALALAISSAQPLEGFMVMLFFGLGTLPMLLSIGFVSQKLMSVLKSKIFKSVAALIFILMGAFYIYSALTKDHSEHQQHMQHQQQQNHSHQH
ncbi:MAG: sulfite exporter TauE/SafE family protein [Gammaproteobacteria bacterium]|nr:sulfite exporter TauE/SafE family protein [Gammaproteobacteria bacterium]